MPEVADRADARDLSRVLVVAPNWLGDAVMALPAIADVRRRYPSARLIVAARRSVAGIFELVPSVDEVRMLEWRGRPLERQALSGDLDRLRETAADAAILLPNSFATAWLVRRAGVAERWGYAADWRRPLLSRSIPRPRGSLHLARYYQHLVRELGMSNGPLEPEVVISSPLLAQARERLVAAGWDGERPLVVMAPGAAYGTAKRWLPVHFGRLTATLIERCAAHVAYIGSGGDAESIRMVRDAVPKDLQSHVSDLAGQTSLTMLAAILGLARVCVSNDSGAMHLAAAAGAPVAALFGPTREHETAPLPRNGIAARVLVNPVWCRPCMLRECPIDHRCMRGLTPARVADEVAEIMNAPNDVEAQ